MPPELSSFSTPKKQNKSFLVVYTATSLLMNVSPLLWHYTDYIQNFLERMCRITKLKRSIAVTSIPKTRLYAKLWPVSPWVIAAVLPLIPSSVYLNRGFTAWFHLLSLVYLLTQSPFLQRVLVVCGTSVCLGWYATMVTDVLFHGRPFCRLLYQNMPSTMTRHMFEHHDPHSGALIYSTTSMMVMLLSNVLDLLGHPILTYWFWCRHRKQGGTLRDLMEWPVIGTMYLYSLFFLVSLLLFPSCRKQASGHEINQVEPRFFLGYP